MAIKNEDFFLRIFLFFFLNNLIYQIITDTINHFLQIKNISFLHFKKCIFDLLNFIFKKILKYSSIKMLNKLSK